ncbi:MAG: hypothetical protein HY298_17150 [Verrucomicrobia bacterium]|nr:hypothetical protein [Verrucomicrobiota bacterium]
MPNFKETLSMLTALVAATASALPPTLRPASHLQFPHATDSNSPGHWDGPTFYLFNSTGHPYRSDGSNIFSLGNTAAVTFDNTVNGGRWMEATWRDTNGTLYGWYHNEPGGLCPGTSLTAPKIGAAKSTDNGANWIDLGIVLEARTNTLRCDAQNGYFAGGNGDFSVMLDAAQQYLYLFISTYAGDVTEQGVAIARMAWSDRDVPVGKVWKWNNGDWQEPGLGGLVTPIFPATVAWERADCEAFWGPSVHWNTYLQQYVMLLNRAKGAGWIQEGIYISYSTNLADPLNWSAPEKILNGGAWYPQVIGLEQGPGTDKSAGALARYFQGGVSDFEICFAPSGCPPSPCLWNQFLDGSSLPASPWFFYQTGGTEGSTSIVNFYDPDIGGTNHALRINSGANSTEWYLGPLFTDEVVAAARFRTVAFSGTSAENLLCAEVGGSGDHCAAPAITIVTNRYKLWSYTEGTFGSGTGGSQILDIGPVLLDQFHTAYIYAHKSGLIRLWWDGKLIFDGLSPMVPNYDGFMEWGSGSWQFTAATTVDFDWVGYGNACNLPQLLRITHSDNFIVISWPTQAVGFVPQSTEILAPANWMDMTNTVSVVGSENTVTNDLPDTARFFRLRKL